MEDSFCQWLERGLCNTQGKNEVDKAFASIMKEYKIESFPLNTQLPSRKSFELTSKEI